ncbi:MAG: hypothetical protein ACTIJ9_11290 [Aequorivita sp.]
MKFVPEYFEFTLPKDPATVHYIQKIQSETIIKKIIKKQTVTRNLKIEINSQESTNAIVSITTEKEELKLDSVLKKQENISNEIAKTIAFVQLKINPLGEMIQILNHDQVLQKWYSVKRKLENEFRGKAIDDYLKGIEKKMENHDALLEDFKQYRLFGGLFNSLYFEHSTVTSKYNQYNRRIENFVFGKPIHFKETILLDKIRDNEVSTIINAELDAEKNNASLINAEFKNKNIDEDALLKLSNYKGNYILNKESGTIKAMNLSITATYGNEFQKKIEYSLTKK